MPSVRKTDIGPGIAAAIVVVAFGVGLLIDVLRALGG
jgi:hypothetical protein